MCSFQRNITRNKEIESKNKESYEFIDPYTKMVTIWVFELINCRSNYTVST